MSDTVDVPVAAAPKSDPLSECRQKILERLAGAIAESLERLHSASQGQSIFENELDARITLELIKQLHRLLPLLPAPVAPKLAATPVYAPPLIPSCPLCREGPGAHWPSDCPLAKSLPEEIRRRLK